MEEKIYGTKDHPAAATLRGYVYAAPDGEWIGRLDDRSWGKDGNLYCYFADVHTGDRYRLSVWFNRNYTPEKGGPSLRHEPLGSIYRLSTGLTRNGLPKLLKAEPLPCPE